MTDFTGGGIPNLDYDKDDVTVFNDTTEFTNDVFVYGKLYAEFGGDLQTFSTSGVERMRITKEGDIIFTTNNIRVSGITTIATLNVSGNTNLSGITTGTFVGDGSGLVGVTASGTGIVVKNSGSTVGTAGTVNFENNLDVVSFSGGAVTVRGSQNFTGVVTATTFVGSLTGTASNATQLNSQSASYYLDYNNFSNTPTIPTNNNQLTNGAGFITGSSLNASNLSSGTIPDARFPSTLPAIDGSNLTNLAGGLVAQARRAIDTSTSTQFNPIGYVDKLTLTVSGVQSTSKILLFYRFGLGHNGSGSTLGRVTGPSLFGGETTFDTSSSTGPYSGVLFDTSSSTTRTFKIQYADNGGVSSSISDTELIAVEIKIS